MSAVTAEHILTLARPRSATDPDRKRRAHDAIAFNPATGEVEIINTGTPTGRTISERLFCIEDGQQYFGIEDDPDALVVLMDSTDLQDQLTADCFDADGKILPTVAEEIARSIDSQYSHLWV